MTKELAPSAVEAATRAGFAVLAGHKGAGPPPEPVVKAAMAELTVLKVGAATTKRLPALHAGPACCGLQARSRCPPTSLPICRPAAPLPPQGIGPATATAIMQAVDPSIPFQAAQAMLAALGSKDYTGGWGGAGREAHCCRRCMRRRRCALISSFSALSSDSPRVWARPPGPCRSGQGAAVHGRAALQGGGAQRRGRPAVDGGGGGACAALCCHLGGGRRRRQRQRQEAQALKQGQCSWWQWWLGVGRRLPCSPAPDQALKAPCNRPCA